MKVPVYGSLQDAQLIKLLQNGGVGVLPTDTVYGLVCVAANQDAVKRLYQLKHREKKPGTIIAASIEQLEDLGIKRRYLTAVEGFWPNPISIIIPTGLELSYLHLGKYSLALRIPDNALLNVLTNSVGPLLTTSANHPGEKSAHTIEEAQKYFGDTVDPVVDLRVVSQGQTKLPGHSAEKISKAHYGVDFYVDGGDLSNHKPSTIIRMIDDAIEVVREGAVIIDEETGRIKI